MLLVFLRFLMSGIARLFVAPPALDSVRIDPNAKCPACGATDGKLLCVQGLLGNVRTVAVRHTCNVCGAGWHESTVAKSDAIVPAQLYLG